MRIELRIVTESWSQRGRKLQVTAITSEDATDARVAMDGALYKVTLLIPVRNMTMTMTTDVEENP